MFPTLDIDPKHMPDIRCDVLSWDYKQNYSPSYFQIITASPPCTEYSRAKTVGRRDLETADRIVRRTLEIIDFFNPKVWWVENPRYGLLSSRSFMKDIPFVDIDYCQFSDWGYMKPTRFWGSPSVVELPPRTCDWETCPNLVEGEGGRKVHRERLGGNHMRFSAKLKGRIPPLAIDYLLRLNDEVIGGNSVRRPRGRRSQSESRLKIRKILPDFHRLKIPAMSRVDLR